jgi:hypothetical protein
MSEKVHLMSKKGMQTKVLSAMIGGVLEEEYLCL